jgi:hypothetical protein
MAAPEGNTNSSLDNRLWGNTIRRAVAQDPEKLRRIAERLLADAEHGDIQAIKEIGDRLDGKPAQAVAVGNMPGEQFITKVVREIVRPKHSNG